MEHLPFKCGQYVTHNTLRYMFLGYIDKKRCLLADRHGNTHEAWMIDVNS